MSRKAPWAAKSTRLSPHRHDGQNVSLDPTRDKPRLLALRSGGRSSIFTTIAT